MDANDILNKIEFNINESKNDLKNYKKNSFKNKSIRNLKICGNVVKSVLPYIIITSTTIGIYKLIGLGFPFVLDNEKIYAKKMYLMQDDNIKSSYTYEFNNKSDNYLTYTSKWTYKNGNYYRNKMIYKLMYYSDENIINLLKSENFDELLGQPISVETEISTSIKENEDSVSVITYDEEKNEFKYIEEKSIDNNLKTILILITLFVFNGLIYLNKDLNNDDLKENIKEIKEQFKLENSKQLLIKTLQIREDNLKYLDGDKCDR